MGTWWSLPCPFYCTDLDIKFPGVRKVTKDEWYKQLFENLGKSTFRSRFHLKQVDIDYINSKGLDKIEEHARDFIAKKHRQ